jgi:hypothetical protein
MFCEEEKRNTLAAGGRGTKVGVEVKLGLKLSGNSNYHRRYAALSS